MIGTRIGHFEVTAKLGAGGMGEVYEATDTELGRTVAIKLLPEDLASVPERLERFRREARVIASLNHPNIVTIHSVESTNGRPVLIMEKVDGETLAQRLPEDGFPVEELLDVAVAIADALAATHSQDIIHRDLKPGNVMITPDGRVKLLDFGLAKPTAGGGDADPASRAETRTAPLTMDGTVLGTAPYVSPEQLRGGRVDARSDIFSLGTLLYEMATGERPFRGGNTLELASSIMTVTPPAVTELRAGLPARLGRVVDHCLQKDPDRRFQTARDVRSELEAVRAEVREPAGVRQDSPGHRSWGRLGLAGALVAITIGAGSAYLLRGDPAIETTAVAPGDSLTSILDDGRLMLAVLPFENLAGPDDEHFADGISEEIRSRLAMLDGLGVISRTTARQFKTNRPPLPAIAAELNVDYVLDGTVRWARAADGTREGAVAPQLIRASDDTQVWTGSYTFVPAGVFEIQAQIAQQVAEELDLEILEPQRRMLASRRTASPEAYALYLEADQLLEQGRELEALEPVLEAIDLYEDAIALDDTFAVAHARLAEAHGYLSFYRLDRTDERLAIGQAMAARALEIDPDSPDAHYAQGLMHAALGNIPSAVEEYALVVQRWPNYAQAFWSLSLFSTFATQWDRALEFAIRARDLNPRAARHHCQVGGMNIALGNDEEAIGHHQLAIQVTPERACPYYCVLEATLSMGDLARAERFLAELPAGIDIEENPSIGFHWVRLDIMQERYDEALARLGTVQDASYRAGWHYVPKSLLAAQIAELRGRADDARRHYELASAHLEPLVEAAPFDVRYRGSLAIAYAGLGRRDDAVRQEEFALPLLERGGIPKPFAIREFAHARVLLGDHDRAIELLRQHLELSGYLGADYLALYPTWDVLRDRTDFQALIEQHRHAATPSDTADEA